MYRGNDAGIDDDGGELLRTEHIAMLYFSVLWMLIIYLGTWTSDNGGDYGYDDDDDGVNGDDEW